MGIREWYGEREVLLTGVTSELGQNLLEKLLRSFPNIKVHTVLRTRDGMPKQDRVKKKIFGSPGFERLRIERPDAVKRVECYEGNLTYEDLGMKTNDKQAVLNVSVVFHAGGSYECLLEFCRKLPNLKAVVVATDIFSWTEDQFAELLRDDEHVPADLPAGLVRLPALAPAVREPMPGYVQLFKAPSAIMCGAGHVLGRPDLPSQIIPMDIAVNTFIAAAWDLARRGKMDEPIVYNAFTVDCNWGDLIYKGDKGNSKYRYPTFRKRGITSSAILHWIIVFFFEWLPSFICDIFLYLLGRKTRMLPEYRRVRDILEKFEAVTLRAITVQRQKVPKILDFYSAEDKELFPLRAEVDLETYILCSAAATRKYCVNEDNLKIVNFFLPTIVLLCSIGLGYYYFYFLQ